MAVECCPRDRIQLLAEHQAAEKLRQWQQRQSGLQTGGETPGKAAHISSGPWIVLKKGARVERVPKFSAKATNDKVEGNPVIRYSA